MRARAALGCAVLAALTLGWGAAAQAPGAPEPAPVERIEDGVYVGASHLARLTGAVRFWRSDVRKLVLRAGDHRIQLTVDLPYVIVDDRTVRLDLPVRSRRGEVQVPVALLDSLPVDAALPRLVHDARRGLVVVLPGGGVVRAPAIERAADRVRITFPLEGVTEARIAGRARGRFQVRFGGYFAGVVRDSAAGLLRGLRPIAVPVGSAFELEVAPEAAGYRFRVEPRRAVLELARGAEADLEPFAAEGPAGPRALRVVVLDPGHGGDDAGVTASGLTEKDLALEFARALKPELERRLRTRVVLTRDRDQTMSAEQRAEAANRARADLVLSLHFDGYPAPGARGATAIVPPATLGSAAPGPAWAQPVEVRPWRDVALRHAVPARALAEALRARLELEGHGPVRIRERLPLPLLGVNAPGAVLEVATLTSPSDRGRLTVAGGLRALAASVAEAVAAWQRND